MPGSQCSVTPEPQVAARRQPAARRQSAGAAPWRAGTPARGPQAEERVSFQCKSLGASALAAGGGAAAVGRRPEPRHAAKQLSVCSHPGLESGRVTATVTSNEHNLMILIQIKTIFKFNTPFF